MSLSPPTPFDRRKVILILGALSTVTPLSIDMYLPAFPQIAHGLGCTTAQVSLSVSSYFVGMALGQLFYGPLLDRFGRKRPVYFGLTLYLVMTLACLCAPSVQMLIAFRFLQALGGCVAQVAAVTMVRDLFPVAESARLFSLLMLILGVSPLLAPSIGSMITVSLGWQWIFLLLAVITAMVMAAMAAYLPEARAPDRAVVLRPLPILRVYAHVFRERQFVTYALAGACSFSGLFIYVAGSPIIFMENFHVSAHLYGLIFGILAIGFIGGNQLNILALRSFSSSRIFLSALMLQIATGSLLASGSYVGWFGLVATLTLLLVLLSCAGFTGPNGSALALAPITQHVGSASALLGFLQMGIGALASAGVGLLDAHTVAPIISVLTGMAALGLAITVVGQPRPAVGAVEAVS